MHRVSLVVLLLMALGLLAACGDDTPDADPQDPGPGWTHVVGEGGATYYLVGPQQAHPPEGTFPAGTKVRLLTEHVSYVRLLSETGVTAYVPTGSITALPK